MLLRRGSILFFRRSRCGDTIRYSLAEGTPRSMSSSSSSSPSSSETGSGYLSSLLACPSTLSPQLRLMTLTAGLASAPDRASQLVSVFSRVSEGESRRQAVEAIAQCVLFVGFPRILTSFAVLETAGFLPKIDEDGSERKVETMPKAVEAEDTGLQKDVFDLVYGPSAVKVSQRMRRFHERMEGWVRDFGYRQVLGRTTALNVRDRELCAIAVLAGLNTPAVLVGHIKGALRVGASREDVRYVDRRSTS